MDLASKIKPELIRFEHRELYIFVALNYSEQQIYNLKVRATYTFYFINKC